MKFKLLVLNKKKLNLKGQSKVLIIKRKQKYI
jgi:hypothetical protein